MGVSSPFVRGGRKISSECRVVLVRLHRLLSAAPALLLVLSVPADGSVGESPSPWLPEIHAETFQSEFGPADGGQENEQDGRH